MSEQLPLCPGCGSEYTYEQGPPVGLPDGWPRVVIHRADADDAVDAPGPVVIRDAAGNRLADGVGDHDIDAAVPGFGRIQLKSSVVKKAS
ncbi:PhnA domain-containing protein [Nesterenkonia suensis]